MIWKALARNCWVGWVAGRPLYVITLRRTTYSLFLFGYDGNLIPLGRSIELQPLKDMAADYHASLTNLMKEEDHEEDPARKVHREEED